MRWARVAKHDHTSINQFIAIAVAEKMSALETSFAQRAIKADMDAFKGLFFRPRGEVPRLGDELS